MLDLFHDNITCIQGFCNLLRAHIPREFCKVKTKRNFARSYKGHINMLIFLVVKLCISYCSTCKYMNAVH